MFWPSGGRQLAKGVQTWGAHAANEDSQSRSLDFSRFLHYFSFGSPKKNTNPDWLGVIRKGHFFAQLELNFGQNGCHGENIQS